MFPQKAERILRGDFGKLLLFYPDKNFLFFLILSISTLNALFETFKFIGLVMTIQSFHNGIKGALKEQPPCVFGNISVPAEVVRNILTCNCLSLIDVLQCSLVSKNMCMVTHSGGLWQRLFFLHFGKEPSLGASPSQAYQHHKYHHNVEHGVYASKTLGSEKDPLVCFFDIIREDLLVATYLNRIVKIWDLNTGKCFHAPKHEGIVTNITYAPDKTLVVVLDECEINCWSENISGQLVQRECTNVFSFRAPSERIKAIIFIANHFFVGLEDGTIRSYEWGAEKPPESFEGHEGQVSCFHDAGGQLISGSSDGTVKIWGVETAGCRVLEKRTGSVTTLKVDPKRPSIIYAGFNDGVVKVWDLTTDECIWGLKSASYSAIKDLVFEEGKLFFKCVDGTIEVWSWCSDKPCYTIKAPGEEDLSSFASSFAHGKLYISLTEGGIQERDFRASDNVILKEIAHVFRKSTDAPEYALEADRRLASMPEAITRQICNVECMAAFGSLGWNQLTSVQKAQLIDNYLSKHLSQTRSL